MYLHYIKSRGGSGDIEAIAIVRDWKTDNNRVESPEPEFTCEDELDYYKNGHNPPSKAWLKISEILRLKESIKIHELDDLSNNKKLKPATLQGRFAPVIDILDPMTEEEFNLEEERAKKLAQQLSDRELGEKAEQTQTKGPVRTQTVTGSRYLRNSNVTEFAKRRAKGRCQLCEIEAPFKDKQGTPYLEAHHIVWLSEGGEDTIENTVALCPNCHRKMHTLDSSQDRNALLALTKF
ncbi:MAG: HNH endonuclease [Candidatus Bathyarchaeia archaeon]